MAELRCAGCELGSLCSDGVLGVRMGALQWVTVAIPAVGAAAPWGWWRSLLLERQRWGCRGNCPLLCVHSCSEETAQLHVSCVLLP